MEAETFFSQTEKDKVENAIREVETGTAGEVVVMVVDQSDTYPEGQILAGIIIGSLLSLIVTDLFFADSLWIFMPIAIVLASAIGWLVNYTPPIKRFFTLDSHMEDEVQEGALVAFYDKGLYQTRDDTGVLFYISLFERKVWVLADKGIYEKIEQEKLQEYARDVAKGVKAGNGAEVLCREIQEIGEILAEHFPIKPGDVDELSNKVIIG